MAKNKLRNQGFQPNNNQQRNNQPANPQPQTTETPVVEAEVHVCPLCESKLEKALDEGKVDTFVNSLLSLDEEDETKPETKKKK